MLVKVVVRNIISFGEYMKSGRIFGLDMNKITPNIPKNLEYFSLIVLYKIIIEKKLII